MLSLLLLSIEVIAGFYWLKNSIDEGNSRIEKRLDAIEEKLEAVQTASQRETPQ